MIRHLLSSLLGVALTSFALGEPTVLWPLPTPPPGSNPAAFAVPRVEWVEHFQKNLTQSRKAPVDLLFDGDSITEFWMNVKCGKPIWDERYGKLNPFDFGISGDRIEHLLWRLQNGQVDGLHPKLIALMIGTNGLGYTPEQIAEGIKTVVEEYRNRCPESIILLQAIFPRGEDPANPARAKIKEVNQIISKLGDGKKVIYIDFGDKLLQPDGKLSAEVMPDFLHPGPKGFQIWADAIQPVIDQVFGKTAGLSQK